MGSGITCYTVSDMLQTTLHPYMLIFLAELLTCVSLGCFTIWCLSLMIQNNSGVAGRLRLTEF